MDLTSCYSTRRWYQEPCKIKKHGFKGMLIATNVATLAIGWLVWGFFQASVSMNLSLLETKEDQATTINRMKNQITRFVEFQNSSPADVVHIGKTVADILSTAQGRQRAFLEEALPQAIRLQVQEGIPASAVVAMAVYESGYGQSTLAKEHHNYFGMKAFANWDGPVANDMPTKDSGVKTKADFRSYSSLYDGFYGFSNFLKASNRYEPAFKQSSGERFVQVVLKAGYCPDSTYLGNIRSIIQRHRLYDLETILSAGQNEKKPAEESAEKTTGI